MYIITYSMRTASRKPESEGLLTPSAMPSAHSVRECSSVGNADGSWGQVNQASQASQAGIETST